MGALQGTQDLALLREKIARIENRPLLAPGAAALSFSGSKDTLNAPPGLLHEIFCIDMRDAGTGLGFALGQARGLIKGPRRALLYVQLLHEAQEVGFPYAPGLVGFGLAPDDLVFCRVRTVAQLLWAVEEAVGCPAIAGVIADVQGHPKLLDFTASRRLSLRAANGGASVFLLRYGEGREASAASLRWQVTPRASGSDPHDDAAPGAARFLVRLEKGHLGDGFSGLDRGWLVEWTQNGFERIIERRRPLAVPGHGPPLSVPAPAALGNRLAQTA